MHYLRDISKRLYGDGILKRLKVLPDDLSTYCGMYLFKNNEQLFYVNALAEKVEISLARCQLVKKAEFNYKDFHSRFALVLDEGEIFFIDQSENKNARETLTREENTRLLPLFEAMRMPCVREMTKNEEQLLSARLLAAMPTLEQRIAKVEKATSTQEYLFLSYSDRCLLGLMHDLPLEDGFNLSFFLLACKREFQFNHLLEKQMFPEFYYFENYPWPLRQLCYWMKMIIDAVYVFLIFLKDKVIKEPIYAFLYLPIMMWEMYFLGKSMDYYSINLGNGLSSSHAVAVFESFLIMISNERLAVGARALKALFFIAALPVTLTHVAAAFAFDILDVTLILLRSSLSLIPNLPMMAYFAFRSKNLPAEQVSEVPAPVASLCVV